MTENNKKLPVINTLKKAFLLVKRNANSLIKSLLPSGILILFLNLIDQFEYLPEGKPILLLFFVVSSVLFTLFAITCHRTILLGNESVPKYGVNSWTSREWRFLWRGIVAYFYLILLFVAVMVPLSFLASSVSNEFGFIEIIIVLGILPGIYIFSRLSILFPATAIEKKVGWDWALDTSKNNGWRLVVVIGLIPFLLNLILSHSLGTFFILDVFLELLGIIVTIFEIAVLSMAFKFLSESTEAMPLQSN